MRLYNTILIGAGKIGLGNDVYKKYRSHLYTLAKDRNINLVAVIDNNKKLKKISKKYDYYFFNKIEDARHHEVDLAVISTPTKTHYKVIMECLKNLKPKKIILVEKPLGGDLKKAKLIKISQRKKVKIFVNYMRLSLPVTSLLKKDILKKKYNWKCIVFKWINK